MVLRFVSGNEAVAYAVKLCRPEVISAIAITPASAICERLVSLIASGELKAKFIEAEGEHSVMSVLQGASLAGCRTFTATSGNGLSFMNDVVYSVPNMRLPIVMTICNRPLQAGAFSFRADYSDSMSVRDSGWIQLYVENNQEAADTIIQAYKIAEDERILLPVMMVIDGWFLSYLSEPVDFPEQDKVDDFLPPFELKHMSFDPEKALYTGLSMELFLMESRLVYNNLMEQAKDVIKEVGKEYGRRFGREYGLIDTYMCEDAELVLVTMGSTSGTAKAAVDKERARGIPVGVVKVRSFRPFPREELIKLSENAKALVTIDRSLSYGASGPGQLFDEVRSALYDLEKRPMLMEAFAGLGGAEVPEERLVDLIEETWNAYVSGRRLNRPIWVGFFDGSRNVIM